MGGSCAATNGARLRGVFHVRQQSLSLAARRVRRDSILEGRVSLIAVLVELSEEGLSLDPVFGGNS